MPISFIPRDPRRMSQATAEVGMQYMRNAAARKQQQERLRSLEKRKRMAEEAAYRRKILKGVQESEKRVEDAVAEGDMDKAYGLEIWRLQQKARLASEDKRMEIYDSIEKLKSKRDKEIQRQRKEEVATIRETTKAETAAEKKEEAKYRTVYDKQEDTVLKDIPISAVNRMQKAEKGRYALGEPVTEEGGINIYGLERQFSNAASLAINRMSEKGSKLEDIPEDAANLWAQDIGENFDYRISGTQAANRASNFMRRFNDLDKNTFGGVSEVELKKGRSLCQQSIRFGIKRSRLKQKLKERGWNERDTVKALYGWTEQELQNEANKYGKSVEDFVDTMYKGADLDR